MVHLPVMMVHDELTAGTLVATAPAWKPTSEIIHAVIPSRRRLLPSVRALTDFLTMCFERVDEV
ncbi:protein of unknown function [Burkholderia multivorans]